ncbi:LacI family transcriptional regulator [Halobacillus andaensis]|uniref:LacI family transcriptional regulator n=1 Tax=Halobacillus andaensis TaxID=1176239 RepID=A0A917BCR7_HALAA|nr:LacI family DNA-binding transcriptional regulator [Halobacillus andaensis]MBP2005529.1 DNA-binding LacI/PurR family transcriptional regulator [Halobacillus andaensis]GGF32201.1 LacI family transcriptional regulator [Halobacillus andaensis]
MTTIKHIAKQAGVSVTTVSRALNGYSDVNAKTRKKIEDVAKELNYSPNSLARSLVKNQSETIGLLVSGFTKESVKDGFTVEVMSGINNFVAETKYDLVLFNTDSSKQRKKTYTQLCKERRVDGVILQGIKTDDPYLEEVMESDIPCVFIDIPVSSDHVGYVSTDNKEGARVAVNHLIELGHRKIAMVNGHEQAFVSKERLEGYKLALQQNNIQFIAEYVKNGSFIEEEAYKQTLALLKEQPDITSIFCASDLMAIGSIEAAKELNYKIPEDLSIIGYDDIPLSSYISPALTTVSQNKYDLGYNAARMLTNMLKHHQPPERCILETELKIRQSTSIRL